MLLDAKEITQLLLQSWVSLRDSKGEIGFILLSNFLIKMMVFLFFIHAISVHNDHMFSVLEYGLLILLC